jgi:glutathione S-transferase
MKKSTVQGAADVAREAFMKSLDGYERILSKQKYIAGDGLTLADLFHVPITSEIYEVREMTVSLTVA